MSDARRPLWVDVTILALAGVLFATMISLGNWQVRRLAWKVDLIEQVDARAFGDPVPAPRDPDTPEYLRVVTEGIYDHDATLRIKAVTEIGPGWWIMTPLETANQVVWINRGFAPTGEAGQQLTRPEGVVQVTGLVRADQPGGTLLENNDPEAQRWVSADLAEMSREAGITDAQTGYFIDDEANSGPAVWPRGGLTRLEFRNTHLVYAITWYMMAALFFVAMAYVVWTRTLGATHKR